MAHAGRRSGWPILAAAVGVAVYLTSLGNDFALDDIQLVRDNPRIRSAARVPELFLEPYWPTDGEAAGLYRPIPLVSFALNRALLGPGPFGFHLVNVTLHGLVCALAWSVVRRAEEARGTALMTALVFAVHPLHTEAVANIVGRAELLAAAGVLAAWLVHRRASEASARGPRLRSAALACACYLLALLSKESAVLAPLVFALEDRLRRRAGGWARSGRPAVALYAVYALAFVVAAALRVAALGGLRGAESTTVLDNPAAAAGTGPRIATALWVLCRYAWLFVWPAALSADYSYDAIPVVRTAGDPRWLVGLLVAAGVVGLGAYGWRRSRPVCLAAAIMVLLLLPASNLPFPVGTLMAERLTYLPSLGACLLVGHLGATLGARARGSPRHLGVLAGAGLVVVSALGLRTAVRNPVWENNLTLSLRDLEVTPRSAKLHAGAGIAHHAAGRVVEAERHYREALAIYPDYAQIHYNLGELLAERGDDGAAIKHLGRAASLAPGNVRPYKTLARLLRRAARLEEALAAFSTGARLDPGDHRFRFDYGRALLAADRRAEAIEVFAGLAHDDPGGLWGGISSVLVDDSQGRTAEAIAACRSLIERQDLGASQRRELERLLAALERRGPLWGDRR
jgi:Flp pilus assembly protein TadD